MFLDSTLLRGLRALIGTAILSMALAACGMQTTNNSLDTPSEPRPNVLLIVADDMGYNELGAWGSEIRTPNLDELALNGLRFTNFHAAPVCAPARAMLLSGTSNHQAGVASMDIKRAYDFGRSPEPDAVGLGMPGYVGHLSERVAALPEILHADGYHTYMAGKWDLGRALENAHMPAHRGFESSFILTTGTAVHLGFPDENASGGIGRADPYPYQENGVSVTTIPENFFSTEIYTSKLIDYIDENRDDGRPFFAWLAYSAPHWPIQLPADWRDRNAGRYDQGYDVVREQRFTRARELGIFPSNLDLSSYQPGTTSWESLSEDERQIQSRAMELYAGMVENMDYHVGRLVTYLEETGQLDNTVILFMSDNGADAGGLPPSAANFVVDNSLDNMGNFDSWVRYGRGWAEAATAPFRDIKGSMAEGGTRVAAFVSHNAVTASGGLDHGFLTYMDVAPTILEITGTTAPDEIFAGREIVPMTGSSFWVRALGSNEPVHSAGESIGSELHGARALVRGDWKLLMTAAAGDWELFNLSEDIGESNDLAEEQPELLAEMVEAWERFAADHGVAY
jgi:arylsulfatase